MQYKLVIFLIAMLGSTTVAAQDTIPAALITEQVSPVVEMRDALFGSPALRVYQRENTYSRLSASFRKYTQDLYLQQEGSGKQQFSVYSETYIKPKKSLTLWGNAYYNNDVIYKVKFNETADYKVIYPYVMADSAGGDLKAETYSFTGGLASEAGKFQLGLTVGYRGQQSFRQKDPRPNNISSDFNLVLSASRKLTRKYALALDLNGRKYSQKNSLSFVNELGYPLVYHDAGLGVYNEFLAGSRLVAFYNGIGYGASLQFSPVDYKGFFAGISYSGLTIDKELERIIDPIQEINESGISGQAGYLLEKGRDHFMVRFSGSNVSRKGTEAKFDYASQISLVKISEDIRYQNKINTASFRTVYGRTGGFADWYAGVEAGYVDDIQRYIAPDRELSYRYYTAGIDLTASKKLGAAMLTIDVKALRQENIDGTGRWNDLHQQRANYSMLNSNFAYLTASGMHYGGNVRVDFPLTAKLSCFIKAGAAQQTGIGKTDYRVMAAFQF